MLHQLSRRVRRGATALALAGTVGAAGACAPSVTTQQEVQLGADYARQINQQLPLVRDASVNQYINRIGRQIASQADPRGIPYQFYVVDADEVNAFAIPGGHVYVNRGLIERSENLSELTGVLAHEVGHVVERHGIEQMQKAQNANTLLGVVYGVLLNRNPSTAEQVGIQVGGSAIFAGYSRDAEREADRVAVPYLVRAGYDPDGLVTMFQELMAERQRNPSRVEQWFSTHPMSEERIENTRAIIQATPGAGNPRLVEDTRDFQSFRARLRALPRTRR